MNEGTLAVAIVAIAVLVVAVALVSAFAPAIGSAFTLPALR